MTEKEVRKLSRAELLEMLVEQGRQMENQEARIKELEAQLEDKTLKIKRAGSIAEASLSVNGVFEAAQKAADQYLENLKQIYESEMEVYDRLKRQEEENRE